MVLYLKRIFAREKVVFFNSSSKLICLNSQFIRTNKKETYLNYTIITTINHRYKNMMTLMR